MSKNSTIKFSDDLNNSLRIIFSTLSGLTSNNNDLILKNTKNGINYITTIQSIISIKFNDEHIQKLFEIILTHAISAEKMSSGGFLKCIEFLSEFLTNKKHNHIQSLSFIPNDKSISNIIDFHTKNSSIRLNSLIKSALNLAGFAGKIVVEKTESQIYSIESTCGYSFDVKSAFDLSIKLEKPRVFCIDGFIESASELEHMFLQASQAQEPSVLFVRGMSEDVLHTIKVNYDRKTLNLIPVIVKFDYSGINTMNDLAIICGCDLVSSNKGDLINKINYDSSPKINSITFSKTKTLIINNSTIKSVLAQINMLQNKRKETEIDDICSLLDERIRSLSSNYVTIRIPDDSTFIRQSQIIDYTLRAIRSSIDYGITNNDELYATNFVSQKYAIKCIDLLSQVGCEIITT